MSGLFCHHLRSFLWHLWAWNLPSDLSSHHVATLPPNLVFLRERKSPWELSPLSLPGTLHPGL